MLDVEHPVGIATTGKYDWMLHVQHMVRIVTTGKCDWILDVEHLAGIVTTGKYWRGIYEFQMRKIMNIERCRQWGAKQ